MTIARRVVTLEDADELYEAFYPGDSLTSRAIGMVAAVLAVDPLELPEPLARIVL